MCVLVNFKLSVKRIIKRQYLGPLSDISIKILVIIGTKGFWTRPSEFLIPESDEEESV